MNTTGQGGLGPAITVDTKQDGNSKRVISLSTLRGIAPTAIEVSGPVSGDSAAKELSDGTVENWEFTTVWNLISTTEPSSVIKEEFTVNVLAGVPLVVTATNTALIDDYIIIDSVTNQDITTALETLVNLNTLTINSNITKNNLVVKIEQ